MTKTARLADECNLLRRQQRITQTPRYRDRQQLDKKRVFDSNRYTIYTSKLSVAEVLSALNRRSRESSISSADYTKFSKDFLAVSKLQYEMIDLSDAVLLESQRLLENYPLRAGDAIQLASALLANAQLQTANLPTLIFLASDVRLLSAAKGEGLQTDDLQNHL